MVAGLPKKASQPLSQLFPASCCLCKESVIYPNICLCALCIDDLPWLKQSCPQCGIYFKSNKLCPACQKSLPHFRRCLAAFEYRNDAVTQLIYASKKNLFSPEMMQLSQLLAKFILLSYKTKPLPDIIIPVPMHWRNKIIRGFNQADSIALHVARFINHKTIDYQLCRRTVHSSPQHLSSKKQRVRNIKNVFSIYIPDHQSCLSNTSHHSAIAGKTIAIIDDVVTTGATVNAMAAILKTAGAKYVDVWAVARTGWRIG